MAFISDIHGNATALEAVIKDIEKKNVDRIFVLGDLCYRGPEPKRALDIVRSLQTDVIKGNADEWVVRGVQKGEVPDHLLDLMNNEREWTLSRLDQTDLEFLAKLPTQFRLEEKGVIIQAFHAAPNDLFTIVLPDSSNNRIQETLMSQYSADIYIYAHIHKPFIRTIDGKIIMNIGSVGLPFDGIKKASYGMIEIEESGISTSIERVEFNVSEVIAKYEELHYPNSKMMSEVLKKASL